MVVSVFLILHRFISSLFIWALSFNQMLVIHGGSNQTISHHHPLTQYVYDANLATTAAVALRACHLCSFLMELTVLPDRLGLGPQGVFARRRTRTGVASPGVRTVLLFFFLLLHINNKSLLSRWSCASRHHAACQADR